MVALTELWLLQKKKLESLLISDNSIPSEHSRRAERAVTEALRAFKAVAEHLAVHPKYSGSSNEL